MKNYHKYLFLLVSMLVSLAANCQVKIHGKVTSVDGDPLEFVTVRVAGTAVGTNTGLDGTFRMSCPQPANDTLTVVFTLIGYDELQRNLIKPRGDLALNVHLKQKDRQLAEVEVTDFRKQTSQMQTIDKEAYCLLYTSPSPRDGLLSRMPSSA